MVRRVWKGSSVVVVVVVEQLSSTAAVFHIHARLDVRSVLPAAAAAAGEV